MPTLICDFGGVVFAAADPQRRLDAWTATSGAPLGVTSGADLSDDVLRGFESGHVGETEYALHLRARLGWTGSDTDLVDGWAAGHGAANLDVLEALTRFRERGWRLIGTSHDAPWDGRAREKHFGWVLALFDRVVAAHEVGAASPDPRFFAGLRGASGQGQRLYVDDDPQAVAAARRAGLDAHLFTGATALTEACRQLVVSVG